MASGIKRLQDRHAAIQAEMRGMLDKVEKEGRYSIGEGEGNEKEKGIYASLEKSLEDVLDALGVQQRLQDRERTLATVPDRNASTPEERAARNGEEPPKPKIPATAVRHAKLKNFHGPDAEERAYKAGMWIRATMFGDRRAVKWCQDSGIELRANLPAQGENVNTAGGYLVPDMLERTIIDLREEYGVFRRECRVIPMGSDTTSIPRRTGGLTAYFVNENEEITKSTKSWDQVSLTAKKLAALVLYSSELAEDAIISLADDLAGEIAYAFARKEDDCGFIGDGTSTYGGMVGVVTKINDGNHAGSIVTAVTGNTAFSTLDLADFHGVTGKLPSYARARAKWYMSSAAFADSMERIAYSQGGNTTSNISGGFGLSFLGYPVVIAQVLNSTLTAQVSTIVALFGDLRLAATMGDRRGITISRSSERYFEFDQLAIKGTERFDINVHDVGDATNAGPIVALKTPAS